MLIQKYTGRQTLHPHMPSTIHNQKGEPPECPSMHGWVNDVWHIPIVLGLKKESIPAPAATRVNLEDVMLREESRTQKDGHCRTSLFRAPRSRQNPETENRWWCGGGGLGEGGVSV